MILVRIFLFIVLISGSRNLCAQSGIPADPIVQTAAHIDTSKKVYIHTILISGNKRTKDYIILREVRFNQGDSVRLALIPELLEQSRNLVYNTTLFTEVQLSQAADSNGIAITVQVKEKWYIFPTPQFKLVDRNFNEWLKRYNGDLERVIYGARFAHYNFSGRRDQLRVYLLTGYARNISFSYSAPYSNSALTEGFAVSAGFVQNREVGYVTNVKNQVQAFRNGGFVRQSFSTAGSYFIRRGHYNSHIISVGFSTIKVNDSVILKSNNHLFNSRSNKANILDALYAYQYVNVNNVAYPLKGNIYAVSVLKRGLQFSGGTNMTEVSTSIARYLDHGSKWYSTIQLMGKIKIPFKVAYINQRAMGFGEFYLRGLENYVVDGLAAMAVKYTLRKKIIAFNIPVPFNFKTVPKIPVAFYAKVFADAGTSYITRQYDTRLNNRLLYSSGFGLDLLTLYDISLRIEYSFNQLGENGLFLHTRGGF